MAIWPTIQCENNELLCLSWTPRGGYKPVAADSFLDNSVSREVTMFEARKFMDMFYKNIPDASYKIVKRVLKKTALAERRKTIALQVPS